MYKVSGWWVMYLDHRKRAQVAREGDFFAFQYKGWVYMADGTCAEMEAMARLFNGELTNVS